MSCVSATLAVWCTAWLHGAAAADDALDALRSWGQRHEFVAGDDASAETLELPAAGGGRGMSGAEFLAMLRGISAGRAWIALPVPGDVRGLGGHTALTKAALRSGEAAVFPGVTSGALGLVGEHVAEGLTRWSAFDIPAPPAPEHVGIGEAEHLLTTALAEAATTLRELDVARERPGVRTELSGKLRAAPPMDWPRSMPQRALRVMQRADEVGTILELAFDDEPGGAHSASAANRRADALRPLSTAVRTARCAAVDETVRILTRQEQHRF